MTLNRMGPSMCQGLTDEKQTFKPATSHYARESLSQDQSMHHYLPHPAYRAHKNTRFHLTSLWTMADTCSTDLIESLDVCLGTVEVHYDP